MSNKIIYECKLDKKTREYAETNLNETEESRTSGIQSILQWIEANPAINAKPDPKSILAFLRGCKFNLDHTQEKLTNYYCMRRDIPEWFRNRNPLLAEIQELVKLGVFLPLLNRNHDAANQQQLIVIIRTTAHDPHRHKQDDVFKAGKMILDIAAMEDELAQIYGVTAIFDMHGLGLAYGRQFTPAMIRKAVYAWQNYHCRPKRLEFINAPTFVNVVLNVFKGFMSNKLKGRVQVHFNGVEALRDIVPMEMLPKEYGGEGESVQIIAKYWYQKLLEYSDWFEDDEQYKAR